MRSWCCSRVPACVTLEASILYSVKRNLQHSLISSQSPSCVCASPLRYIVIKMVSKRDRELLRDNVRSRGAKLSATDRENIMMPYLPDPSELPRWPAQRRKRLPRRTPIRTFIRSQIHLLTYAFLHFFFGIALRIVQTYRAVVDRILAIIYYHHRTPELIKKDVQSLDRLPEHLSVILSLRKEEDALPVLMDEVAELVSWSASAGIPILSVYEKSGMFQCIRPSVAISDLLILSLLRCPQVLHTRPAPYHYQKTVILLWFLATARTSAVCTASPDLREPSIRECITDIFSRSVAVSDRW